MLESGGIAASLKLFRSIAVKPMASFDCKDGWCLRAIKPTVTCFVAACATLQHNCSVVLSAAVGCRVTYRVHVLLQGWSALCVWW